MKTNWNETKISCKIFMKTNWNQKSSDTSIFIKRVIQESIFRNIRFLFKNITNTYSSMLFSCCNHFPMDYSLFATLFIYNLIARDAYNRLPQNLRKKRLEPGTSCHS